MRHIRTAFIALTIGTASATLAACGSAETNTDALASVSPSPSVSREAGLYKSTNVCVRNTLGRDVTVEFTKYDTRQNSDNTLRSGQTACAEGTFVGGWDVEATITDPKAPGTVLIFAVNPSVGAPELVITNDSDYTYGFCPTRFFDEDAAATRTADDGATRYTAVRLPDTAWKQFEITLSPSQGREWVGECGGRFNPGRRL